MLASFKLPEASPLRMSPSYPSGIKDPSECPPTRGAAEIVLQQEDVPPLSLRDLPKEGFASPRRSRNSVELRVAKADQPSDGSKLERPDQYTSSTWTRVIQTETTEDAMQRVCPLSF
jgi:hypothetical protein